MVEAINQFGFQSYQVLAGENKSQKTKAKMWCLALWAWGSWWLISTVNLQQLKKQNWAK